ncbi:zinc-ribbon domain containing protein [Leeia sp.]|uniref:zinc-ribbon domain containing protein n=1 Tax=Leeia sp. TaxID=2884678 RepID=UPI0035AE9DA3
MPRTKPLSTVPANPANWCETSQRSVSAAWTRHYTDRPYTCWRCKVACVFTAADQRYTYEVKKASIDQHRLLCRPCWQRRNAILLALGECQARWNAQRTSLRQDPAFLSTWLALLDEKDQYIPYRRDTAKKNMLRKLLNPPRHTPLPPD